MDGILPPMCFPFLLKCLAVLLALTAPNLWAGGSPLGGDAASEKPMSGIFLLAAGFDSGPEGPKSQTASRIFSNGLESRGAGSDPVNRWDPSGLDWIWNGDNKGTDGYMKGWSWNNRYNGSYMSKSDAIAKGMIAPEASPSDPLYWGNSLGLTPDDNGIYRIGADIETVLASDKLKNSLKATINERVEYFGQFQKVTSYQSSAFRAAELLSKAVEINNIYIC